MWGTDAVGTLDLSSAGVAFEFEDTESVIDDDDDSTEPWYPSYDSGWGLGSAHSVDGDLNGDGFLDLVLGAPGRNTAGGNLVDGGTVFVLHGGPGL